MTTEHDDPGFEPPRTSSPTDHVLAELQLHGYRPFQDEPDPRPLPQAQTIAGAVADIFDALVVTLGDTRLEPDLEELLWSSVNLFHRAVSRIERELIRARTGEGRERAKARGVHMGRPSKLTVHQRQDALKALADGTASQADLARRFNVSQSTISRLMP